MIPNDTSMEQEAQVREENRIKLRFKTFRNRFENQHPEQQLHGSLLYAILKLAAWAEAGVKMLKGWRQISVPCWAKRTDELLRVAPV